RIMYGSEFADLFCPYDVLGSKGLPELVSRGQIRMFSKEVKSRSVIERISFESFDNRVAPTLIGLTAELPAGLSRAAAEPASNESKKIQALIVGAGSSHDFQRWFRDEDSRILRAAGAVTVQTTDKPDDTGQFLGKLDVLYLANNAPFTDTGLHQRIMDFANSGKGLLLVHPALWYNWPDWPE